MGTVGMSSFFFIISKIKLEMETLVSRIYSYLLSINFSHSLFLWKITHLFNLPVSKEKLAL